MRRVAATPRIRRRYFVATGARLRYRDAKDLAKLAVLAKGSDDVAKSYYKRALPEIRAASKLLDDVVGLLPP